MTVVLPLIFVFPVTVKLSLIVVAVCRFIDVPIISVSTATFPTCISSSSFHNAFPPFKLYPYIDVVELYWVAAIVESPLMAPDTVNFSLGVV